MHLRDGGAEVLLLLRLLLLLLLLHSTSFCFTSNQPWDLKHSIVYLLGLTGERTYSDEQHLDIVFDRCHSKRGVRIGLDVGAKQNRGKRVKCAVLYHVVDRGRKMGTK
jgi:hypothetical protein